MQGVVDGCVVITIELGDTATYWRRLLISEQNSGDKKRKARAYSSQFALAPSSKSIYHAFKRTETVSRL